ncbi:MAG: hemerythrin domain-containing protein [Bacteroidota bacterium]
MKRHPALIPLSREHHQMLLVAQLLKRDAPPYKGLPTDPEGKVAYARRLWRDLIEDHLTKEEEVLFPMVEENEALNALVSELRQEHHTLRKQWQGVEKYPNNLEVSDTFGRMLEAHIRKEERVFFQKMQAELPEDVLVELGKKMGSDAPQS